MALRNIPLKGATGARFALGGPISPVTAAALVAQPSQPIAAPTAAQPATPVFTARIRPDLISKVAIPPRILTFPPRIALPKTTTQLAQGAINQLKGETSCRPG